MSAKWRERMKRAEKSNKPVFIITPEEAKKNEGSNESSDARSDRSSDEGSDRSSNEESSDGDDSNEKSDNGATKTWIFKADRVRDFAFASSKKFIWDALQHDVGTNRNVMAMSFYPNEAETAVEQIFDSVDCSHT